MKTNHQRGFVRDRNQKPWKGRYLVYAGTKNSLIADRSVHAGLTLGDCETVSQTKRLRKAKRGTKKFVNSRFRFHENAATKKLAEINDDS